MSQARPAFRPVLEALEERQAPAVLTVNTTADYTTRDNSLTLREAIAVVNGNLGRSLTGGEKAQISGTLGSNDTIRFNLPSGPQTITLTGGALYLGRSLAIKGPGAAILTINGNGQDRVFTVGYNSAQSLNLNVSLCGLTIAGGSNAYGAGLLNYSTLRVTNCSFANNSATANGGGGIYNIARLTLTGCTFTGNSTASSTNSTAGGGIYSSSKGTVTISNCSFTGNTALGSGSTAGSGGAISNSGTMTVAATSFTNNLAASDGGAVYTNGTFTATNCPFLNNTAQSDGGAIRNSAALTLTGCTIAGNFGASEGGGLDGTYSQQLTVTNCTFANNTAGSQGGGLKLFGTNMLLVGDTITANRVTYGDGSLFGGGILILNSVTLYNTIVCGNFKGVSGNAPSDIDKIPDFNIDPACAFNLIGTGGSAGLVNGVNNNQVGVTNAGLGALANNGGPMQTIALLPGSPAIAHGSNAYVSAGATDGRGLARVVNGTIDIGAFEVQTTSAAPLNQTASTGMLGLFNLGSFTDANIAGGPWSVDVNWGDGSADTIFTATTQGTLGAQGHTYVSAGTATVTVTVSDINHDSSSATFVVNITGTLIQTPTSLVVAGFPSPTTQSVAGSFTVTAMDANGNPVSGYTGTVHFVSSDPGAALPQDYTFVPNDDGIHTFSATLQTPGVQSLTATDTLNLSLTGTQSGITVNAVTASGFVVGGFPSPTTQGVAASFTVTAVDTNGNPLNGYTGTVHFTSSDPHAVLPLDYTFVSGDQGKHTFSATLQTTGTQALTATDSVTASIIGTQSAITVNPAHVSAVLTVNSTVDSTSPDNFLTLREAIGIENGTLGRSLTAGEQAQIYGTLGSSDVIAFNLPAGAQTIALSSGALSITHALTINGPGAANLTINGNNRDRVFIVGTIWSRDLSLAVAINGLTIAGGNAAYGAGLLNFGTLTVSNTTFANNSATSNGGGGLYNVGAGTLNNCTFTGNAVSGNQAGGGIENISSGIATINGCTFSGNTANGSGSTASSGAAIANSGKMSVTASTFDSNTAASDGGAIYNDGALTIATSSFTNNAALSDGGAIRSGGSLSLSRSTFAWNSAASVGGALDTSDSSMSTINCTFANNTAISGGGAIIADAGSGAAVLTNDTITANRVTHGTSGTYGGGLYFGRPMLLQNTIVAGNFQGAAPSTTPNDIYGRVDPSSSFNLIGTGGSGALVNGVNGNQVGVTNPGLGTLTNNGGPILTIALLAGSPAIDYGSNTFVTAGETDELGMPRIDNGIVDIGAFEF
jgi:predicted outer membrane repeat protein